MGKTFAQFQQAVGAELQGDKPATGADPTTHLRQHMRTAAKVAVAMANGHLDAAFCITCTGAELVRAAQGAFGLGTHLGLFVGKGPASRLAEPMDGLKGPSEVGMAG